MGELGAAEVYDAVLVVGVAIGPWVFAAADGELAYKLAMPKVCILEADKERRSKQCALRLSVGDCIKERNPC